MKKTLSLLIVLVAALALAQQSDIIGKITGGGKPAIAVPDIRGAGSAQQFMAAFNKTLWDDLQTSGILQMVSKSVYPLQVPQRPQDFKPPIVQQPSSRNLPAARPVSQGPWLTDWSNPPVNANFLAYGYTAEQNGQLVLFGWLYNVTQADIANAQVFGKIYLGSLDEEGARKVAHEFSTDILNQFGAASLAGSKIYFVSNRTGNKEIWSMDYDGSNQKSFTSYRTITTMPAVSKDGTKIAFTSYLKGNPSIIVHSLETGRRLPFYNQNASLNMNPTFTPDGQQIIYASSASGVTQLYTANMDGSGLRRLTSTRAIEVEPKVNPKTGSEIVFVSGRSGPPQLYKMNIYGADAVRLTTGEGEATNPSWHPDGQHIAFSWTRGYDPGNFNIFVMDVATGQYVQLTHGAGRNENPCWAPDGRHLVFDSNRSGSSQIWTMLADGTQLKQLTTSGRNEMPIWSNKQ